MSANIIIHSLMSNCQRRKQLPFTVKQLQTIQDNNDYVHSMILLNVRGYSIHGYEGWWKSKQVRYFHCNGITDNWLIHQGKFDFYTAKFSARLLSFLPPSKRNFETNDITLESPNTKFFELGKKLILASFCWWPRPPNWKVPLT